MKKKLLLTIAALGVTLSTASAAGWNGYYVRGDLAWMGTGVAHKKNESEGFVNPEGSSDRLMHLGLAGGWGKLFSGSMYGGIDVTAIGVSGVLKSADVNEFSFVYDPKATIRVGMARCNMLVYAGGGVGALYAFTDLDKQKGHHQNFPKTKDNKNETIFTWHARVGVDFKIKGNWFCGMFYEYQRSMAHANEGDAERADLSMVSDRVAAVFGMQM